MIKVAMSGFNAAKLDSAFVQSFSDHVILNNLLVSLVRYNSIGRLEGNLAKAWKIEDDYKRYIFTLSDQFKYSDGSQITSKDVVNSLNRSRKTGGTVHYDFKKISKITELDVKSLQIELVDRDPFFLFELDHPEFGILAARDQSIKSGSQEFKITSGPFYIKKSDHRSIELHANPYFPKEQKSSPEIIYLFDFKAFTESDSKQANSFDLVIPPTNNLNTEIFENWRRSGYNAAYSEQGFSYWIALNPNSQILEDLCTRQYIQAKIHQAITTKSKKLPPYLYLSDQIFLPNGPGRPDKDTIKSFWQRREAIKCEKPIGGKKLIFLMSQKFVFRDEVIAALQKIGFELNIQEYKNFTEYSTLIAQQSFDLLQVNNDLASIDLRGALNVTFNQDRPLIIRKERDSSSNLDEAIRKMNSSFKDEERFQAIKEIGITVLENALVVPIYFSRLPILTNNRIDASAWTSPTPEFDLWKIKLL